MPHNFKHWFTPQTIKIFSSQHNPQIEVVKFANKLRLDIGSLTQSGPIIENIWKNAFSKLLPKSFLPQKVLILGFGAGSAAKLIHQNWPPASITGIEIDPVVVQVATDYFQIKKIKNLEIINTDALKFISQSKSSSLHYDLTLVDCYLGHLIPPKLQDLNFLTKLKSLTNYLLINRLFWDQYKTKTLQFLPCLEKAFQVSTCRTPSNLVISLQSHREEPL